MLYHNRTKLLSMHLFSTTTHYKRGLGNLTKGPQGLAISPKALSWLYNTIAACNKSPWAYGPRAFGHPCASPQSPQQSVLFLKQYIMSLITLSELINTSATNTN